MRSRRWRQPRCWYRERLCRINNTDAIQGFEPVSRLPGENLIMLELVVDLISDYTSLRFIFAF
jgi:hypothetical protein